MKHRFVPITAMASIALLLSACTPSSDQTRDPSERQVLTIAHDLSLFPEHLDPLGYRGGLSFWMTLMYGSMAVPDGEGGLLPGLATAWDYPDATTLALTLREGVTFQDGTPLNAEAVKFSWDRVINDESGMLKIGGVAQLESVEVDSEYQVTARFSAPVLGEWRDRLLITSDHMAVLSPTAVEELGDDFSRAPADAGAGPYAFSSHRPGERIELRAWDGYWDADSQTLAGVDIVQTAPGAPTVTALVGGSADMGVISPSDVATLEGMGLEVTHAFPANFSSTNLNMCTASGPLSSLDARKAVVMSLDREELVEEVLDGFGDPISGVISPESPFSSGQADPYPYDPDEAARLATASGLNDVTLRVMVQSTPVEIAVGQRVQSQLKDTGIEVELIEVASYFAGLPTVAPDIAIGSEGNFPGILPFYLPGGNTNWCDNAHPAIEAHIMDIRDISLNVDELTEAYAALQTAIYDDLPSTALFARGTLVGHTTGVADVAVDGIYRYGDLRFWNAIGMN